MVLGNSIIGNLLKKNNIKSIFRNHEKPTNEKTTNLKKIISEFDIKFRGSLKTQKDIKELQKVFKNNKCMYLNDFLLKSQSKAYYEKSNKGHFGLSLEEYTHFTSPIRRYSDLIVHRDLVDLYFKRTEKKKNLDISSHLNLQEKKADLIEKRILDRACSLYLRKLKKYEFKGFVDSIESFGIFIRAIDYPFSGLARVRNNMFFSRKKYSNKTKYNNSFKIGQLVSFRIKRNNVYNGKILLDKVKVLEDEEKI